MNPARTTSPVIATARIAARRAGSTSRPRSTAADSAPSAAGDDEVVGFGVEAPWPRPRVSSTPTVATTTSATASTTTRRIRQPPVALYSVVAIVHASPDRIAEPIPPSSHFRPADEAE